MDSPDSAAAFPAGSFSGSSSMQESEAHSNESNARESLDLLEHATTEDEFGIRLWDLRMLKHPLKDLPGHSHCTWVVRHNPEYDELLLSAGTDSTVNLWLAKVSSDDSEYDSPSGSPNRQEEPLLNSYTGYEDSIYGIVQTSYCTKIQVSTNHSSYEQEEGEEQDS